MSDDSDLLDDGKLSIAANPVKYPFLKDLGLDQDVERRLTLHLDRLQSGDSTVLVSAIAKEHDPQRVLELWKGVFNSKIGMMNQTLLDLESSNLDKFGPRSIAKPWSERIPDIEAYYKAKSSKLDFDIYSGIKSLNKGKLRPLSVEAALGLLKNSTNSGLPYYTKKGLVKKRTMRKAEYLLSRRDPCILFTRTQEGGKTRNVWGYPCADTLEEMRYYRPILDFQSRLSWRSALVGPDEVSKKVTMLLGRCNNSGGIIFSGDIKSFDANTGPAVTYPAFYYMKQLFQYDYRAGLDRICDRFVSIGLLTPNGVVEGIHGVPSGSTFTNEVDSIVQYLILKSCGVEDDCIQIQGDDLLLCTDDSELDKIKNRYFCSGLPFNDSKCMVSSESCLYLQNLYHIDYMNKGIIGGIYPTFRALCRILYQERWSDFEDYDLDGIDYYSIRTISILENCKHHPLFRDLVEFIYRLDKYSLRFSQKSISKYDAMLNNSSGVGGFLYNQYGDRVKGINNFETVKIIRTLG